MRYTVSSHVRAAIGLLVILFVGSSYRHDELVSWFRRHPLPTGVMVLVGIAFHFFNVYFGRRQTWATGS